MVFLKTKKGVLILDIAPGQKAHRAGLRRGDLIKEMNHQPVLTVDEFENRYEKINSGENVQLLIKRGNFGFYVVNFEK